MDWRGWSMIAVGVGVLLLFAWAWRDDYLNGCDVRDVKVRLRRRLIPRNRCCECCPGRPPIVQWVWVPTATMGRGKRTNVGVVGPDRWFDTWDEAIRGLKWQTTDKKGRYRPERLFSEITYYGD